MMTFRQLAEWLAKGNGQVCSGNGSGIAFGYDEIEKKDDEPVPLYYKVRRWGDDEWIPPFYEVYKEDCLCLKDSNKDEKQKDDNDVKMAIQVPSTEKIYERGFNVGLNKANKEIAELEKENADLKERIKWYSEQICNKECAEVWRELSKAKELILKLYNAGRDVLMCRTEEKAYDNLSEAINDRSIEQFLKEKMADEEKQKNGWKF